MAHNRKYVSSGIGMTMISFRNAMRMRDQDKVEDIIIRSGMLDGAPFKWVGMVYRYGIKNDLKVRYSKIDKKDGELEVKIELNSEILEWADQNNLRLMYDIFMIGALDVLLDIAKKYGLKDEVIREERKRYGNIPNTIEECEEYKAVGPDYKVKVNRCPNCNHIRIMLESRQCLKCDEFHEPNIVEE